jgi:hypothetical protein
MSMIRSALVRVAIVVLLVHASAVAATTVLLSAGGNAAADLVCTCEHGTDHTQCPMHHDAADSARCHMQSTSHELGTVLLSVFGPLTLPLAAESVAVDGASSPLVGSPSPFLPERATSPSSPPPRS